MQWIALCTWWWNRLSTDCLTKEMRLSTKREIVFTKAVQQVIAGYILLGLKIIGIIYRCLN